MVEEPESLMLQWLRDMRSDIATIRGVMVTKNDFDALREQTKNDLGSAISTLRDELKSDMNSLRADVASDFIATRKEFNEQIVGLRRAVVEYHTTVIGHGVLISELEARLRRVEQHLKLDASDAH